MTVRNRKVVKLFFNLWFKIAQPIRPIFTNWAGLAVLFTRQILNGSNNFLHTFYHKWGVKNKFTFALQFFLLISDDLGGGVLTFKVNFQCEGPSEYLLLFSFRIINLEEIFINFWLYLGFLNFQGIQDTLPTLSEISEKNWST